MREGWVKGSWLSHFKSFSGFIPARSGLGQMAYLRDLFTSRHFVLDNKQVMFNNIRRVFFNNLLGARLCILALFNGLLKVSRVMDLYAVVCTSVLTRQPRLTLAEWSFCSEARSACLLFF